ncbi:MAG TPA: phosphate signaling complex protein PhoU [Alphaproteobacteria bacterium]|nr:phosphate signaling complex protein PhoU [Alphaproteobacteria bacterium]
MEHTVKSFDEQLRRLNEIILRMGGLAEAALSAAMQAVAKRDVDLAAETVREDTKIDNLNAQVDELAVRLLALRQPMANDLREIVAALRISADVERIGDYAANIAKRSIAMAESRPSRSLPGIARMGRLAQRLIKDVLDAYAEKNADKAMVVWARDEEIDDAYNSLFRETLTYMMEDPRTITASTHLLFVAKNIERIGDHATNVAETVYFMVKGQPLKENRPKGDKSPFATVPPPANDAPRE